MQPLLSVTQDWRRPFWLGLMIAASVAFTFGFACAMPFAALAAATALTLKRRDAVLLIVGAWLANQLIGFLFMGYPTDATTLAWGPTLLAIGLASMWAARVTAERLREMKPLLASAIAFLAAFAVYEAGCFASALVLGGVDDFTLAVQARVFAINVCAFAALFLLNSAAAALRIAPAPSRAQHA